MRIGCFIFGLLILLRPQAGAQGFQSLVQYFEADSTARPGFSSIREQKTKTQISKNRELKEVNTIETYYDTAGRLIRENRSGNTGEFELTFGYDSVSGRLNYVEQTKGRVRYEAFAQYDGNGRLSETVYCPADKPCTVRHYFYDADNTERVYIPRQTIELKFNKDKPGSLFGFSALNKEKDELVRERFFDPEGKLEEIRQYASGKFTVGWIFDCDHLGRRIKVWVFNEKEKILASEFEYGEGARLPRSEKIHAWVVGDQILPYRESGPETVTLTYDDHNRLIKTESGDNNASTIREYTYYEY